jgi:hypothetical protein
MVCIAGPAGERARALLGPDARLAWVFGASSHFDAMTRYHERMEWAPYRTTESSDTDPYPREWIEEQHTALASQVGNRDVIANGPMARAWRAAAEDLGVRFESPFSLDHDGVVYWCAGWLPDFGGPKGTIIACMYSLDDVFEVVEQHGFYASGLSPYYYWNYERERFIETLNDWGWFGGSGEPPTWFAGAHRAHGGVE